ncbi:MAG: beta-L-arabinofuranosidase domain-containing protein [Bryobacteraceae bacterium]
MFRIAVLTLLVPAALLTAADWRNEGVIYTSHSPHAKLHPVPVHAVTIGAGFWAPRRKTNVERSIPTMLELLKENGRIDNFLRLEGKSNAPRRGPLYTDSDIYKWMEAAAFVLQSGDDPALRATFDRLTGIILAAQEPSGYLNTYWGDERRKAEEFTQMQRSHELYCLGHLTQAAIAYYRATGDRRLLDGAIKYVDYLVRDFGPEKRPLLTGHPEFEMAAIELYRTTGNRAYLRLAGYLLSGVETGRLRITPADLKYMFSGKPFTERTVFEGHAVRAMYASSGATDYYAETGDAAYRQTLETLWRDLTGRKMYITGGVGSRSQGEAFGEPYELPNAQAYGESCAAIGNMMWNYRMLAVTGEARFADVIERALYNGINSGMSLEGTMYCYRNPLASNGEKIRNPWYDTTCCPPNLERILASLPGYFYATSADGVYVSLYDNSVLDWHLEDGAALKIEQKTNYPWDGEVRLGVSPASPKEFTLFVRIPAWSAKTAVLVNGKSPSGAVTPGEYFAIHRRWQAGDAVTLRFDMQPRLTAANARVTEDTGKAAVERGPLVYCLEGLDQPGADSLADISLAASGPGFTMEMRKNLLDGIVVLKHRGTQSATPSAKQPLYMPLDEQRHAARRPIDLTFIPYYTWANREPSQMEVWITAP